MEHNKSEFRVNGVAKDSRRVQIGGGAPVPSQEREAFEREGHLLAGLRFQALPVVIDYFEAILTKR